MPTIDVSPNYVVPVLVLIAVLVVLSGIVRRRRREPGLGTQRSWSPSPDRSYQGQPIPAGTVRQARELIERGQMITAIRDIRRDTGLGLVEAKQVAEMIAAGDPVPTIGEDSDDLATRARELYQAGLMAEAVALVRSETGMTEDDAARFVASLS